VQGPMFSYLSGPLFATLSHLPISILSIRPISHYNDRITDNTQGLLRKALEEEARMAGSVSGYSPDESAISGFPDTPVTTKITIGYVVRVLELVM
jgi:hypothetical protein